ncbi:MAG TPA: hypothetical protein VL974_16875 [Magnetospirillum sp.]|nr:hypothetical protein [Magnetospirillum sp.]
MPTSDSVVVTFPAGDAGTLAWRARGLDNAARQCDSQLTRIDAASRDFALLGQDWARLAAEAAAVLASLECLGRDVDVLRRVVGEFIFN